MGSNLNLDQAQIMLVLAETMAKLELVTGSDEMIDICMEHFRKFKAPTPIKVVAE